MEVYNPDGSVLMRIESLHRENNHLIIDGTIMESMPIRCKLTPTQTRSALKLIGFRLFFFIFSMLFRS